MSRRSEGDAMPGWSTILRVDRSQLGLDDPPAQPEIGPGDEDPDEATQHDPSEAPPSARDLARIREPTRPQPQVQPAPSPVPRRDPVPSSPPRGLTAPVLPPARKDPSRLPAPTGGPRRETRREPSTPFEETTEPPHAGPLGGADIEEVGTDERTMMEGVGRELHFPEQTESDSFPASSRTQLDPADPADQTLHDMAPVPESARRKATSVMVQGVTGDRIPPVITRRQIQSIPSPSPDPLLANAPVSRVGLAAPGMTPINSSSVELTQINAAAALGIAPEPAAAPSALAPAALGGAADKTPPPVIDKVDFGPLKLTEREEVLARYPVETPGISAAERLGARAPGLKALSRVLPVVIMAGVLFAFLGAFMVGPLSEMMRLGERKSRRAASMKAPEPTAEPAPAHTMPKGAIRVVTRPPRSGVDVDQYFVGRAPLLLAPPVERPYYEVKVTSPGFKPWLGELRVSGDSYVVTRSDQSPSQVDADLRPDDEDDRFQLTITLEPEG